MIVELIKQNEQTTSNWSGGTTTQIAIYPKDAIYSEKNFMWRLSSARVDLEESTFTSLPGIWRLIMVLEGEMKLEHTGHHSVYLKPFEQDSFSGDWTTTSLGKVRDFNLMMAEGCSGELMAIEIKEKTSSKMTIHNPNPDRYSKMTSAFYCVVGKLSITIDDTDIYELTQGDLLLLSPNKYPENLSITIANTGNSQAYIIKADIKYY
ncbi:HutD/Ves family protein [Sporomusa malonica]|uniref:HutD protein n=1 Tax=Sporomusa malonica TaxID=112901 RepID=A0A1W2C3C6_9FIRM|nr:HutD family protein [Sporomusa malonica]SMC79601.1 HutD protein [Sporomusa malonica]